MTQKWYVTLRHPNMHSHTKFGIPTSKEYRRNAPDSMPILQTRSEVDVTVTQGWYTTLRYPKMHLQAKLGFLPQIIRDMLRTRIFLKPRSEVKVTVTQKWYETHRHPKMHPHTNFGIPISNNTRDMLRT